MASKNISYSFVSSYPYPCKRLRAHGFLFFVDDPKKSRLLYQYNLTVYHSDVL